MKFHNAAAGLDLAMRERSGSHRSERKFQGRPPWPWIFHFRGPSFAENLDADSKLPDAAASVTTRTTLHRTFTTKETLAFFIAEIAGSCPVMDKGDPRRLPVSEHDRLNGSK